jgi:hypothetical protein
VTAVQLRALRCVFLAFHEQVVLIILASAGLPIHDFGFGLLVSRILLAATLNIALAAAN